MHHNDDERAPVLVTPSGFAGYLRRWRDAVGEADRQRQRAERAEAELAETRQQLQEAQQVAEELATYLGQLEGQRTDKS